MGRYTSQFSQADMADLRVQLETLRGWVEAETGMDFSGSRFQRLCDAAGKVLLRRAPLTSLNELTPGSEQRTVFLEQLTAELTVGESFFFRNEHHFQALREHILPSILRDNAERREVRVWSAGCATGEEPYSLAILLDQVLGNNHNWKVPILGTDLNPEFLVRARQGCYRSWSFRHTDICQNRSYFTPEQDSFQLVPKVRDTVRFAYLNLVKDVYPSPLTGTLGLDLILFRNVAIYLKPEVTARIIERLYEALRPGAWLLLGETEVSLAPTDGFEVRRFGRATFYQKTDRTAKASGGSSSPVLADFVVAGSPLPSLDRAQPEPPKDHHRPVVQSVAPTPTLPEWVPLPKRRPARHRLDESSFEHIQRLLAEHQVDDAERAIDRIADCQRRATARLRLAQRLLASAEIDRARRTLVQCLAEEPLMIEAQLLHASFAEEAGDLATAEQAYRRALFIDRNCPMAHFHLALVLQQLGDVAGSTRSAKTALKLLEKQDPHELVEYGEGVCCGRLKEMTQLVFST